MKRFVVLLLALLMLPIHAAAEEAPIPIRTPEELLAVANNPAGSYILMEDLDMTGVEWESPDFFGRFDGNGHAILNLTISRTGSSTVKTYDGNLKEYDTACAGLFATLQNAWVGNLRLINLRGIINADSPCFVGGIAGFSENSVIENCEISGMLELRAYDRMFGIGGVVGYGCGQVANCETDMTLICVDTDAESRDEQFLGGVYGGGYIHVTDCLIRLDAYISEHGYVHSGGLTGMFLRYPGSTGETARFQNNRVEGSITFFEDNPDRRAYCEPFIGEILVYTAFYFTENSHSFLRRELTDCSRELRPEMCEAPIFQETVTPAGCSSFGFSSFRCEGCGYTYTDCYTLPRHTLTNWTVAKEATETEEGLEQCACDLCGQVFTRVLAKLPPQPTQTQPPVTEDTAPQTEPAHAVPEEKSENSLSLFTALTAAVALAGTAILLIRGKGSKRSGKYRR